MERAAPFVLALLAPGLLAQTRAATAPAARPPVAKLSFADDLVERAGPGEGFERAGIGATIRTGDRIRTGPQAAAIVEFSWMQVSVAASSQIAIPEGVVLASVLETGRVEQRAAKGDLLKLVTAEAQVRGQGHVVVRRREGRTCVTVREGRFRVEAKGKAVELGPRQATLVEAGHPPQPASAAPAPPRGLSPGGDALYVLKGEPVPLAWTATGATHHLQVLGLESEDPLVDRDVAAPPARVALPWLGTFRWRVSTLDARGLEGPPSHEGLICVVEK